MKPGGLIVASKLEAGSINESNHEAFSRMWSQQRRKPLVGREPLEGSVHLGSFDQVDIVCIVYIDPVIAVAGLSVS